MITSINRPIGAAAHRLRKFVASIEGVAGIEAAFILPVMLVIYFGLLDLTTVLSANRRVTQLASTLADLVTQSTGTITKAELDGFYFCPLMPKVEDPRVIEHPDRKPGPGMLQRAARELGLDLARSFMVGDTISDMLAGRNAGCRGTILVRTGYGTRVEDSDPAVDHVVADIGEAGKRILELGR